MKQNKKGFTLVEVIVALAVFAIMALMLTTMFTVSAKMHFNNQKFNEKTDNQSAYATAGGIGEKKDASGNILTKDEKVAGKIKFDVGTSIIPVDIDVITIEGDVSQTEYDGENPNIKIFTKQP
ncbi:MAG: prepilin-type N-terminal cleavage/methylation domain-containing protein [Oscillospiraceae bacterium]